MNGWQVLATAVSGGGLAGVIGALVTGMLNRPKTRADAVATLTDSALKQVNELQERTAEAEREALAARAKMRELSGEIDAALATLRSWRAAILAPVAVDADVRLEQLRAMVRDPGAAMNGRHL